MNDTERPFDLVVVGSGPAGVNAAIAAANRGARVLLIEREKQVGGSCVQYGTIPSKTLRETAVTLTAFKRRSGGVYDISEREGLEIRSLMTRLHQVVEAHQATTRRYLDCAGVESMHGVARFISPHELDIRSNLGESTIVYGEKIVIATGSRPRNPPEIPVDHENIMDSDSVLSMTYLPRSLVVFGGGVIASEYASTFASLGVDVTMIDRYPTPLGFLDSDLAAGFLDQYESYGGKFVGNAKLQAVEWDGAFQVVTTLEDGTTIESDKALVAQGRVANTDSLAVDAAGLALTDRGLIGVDQHFRTKIPSIFAVGDAIGSPALASASMQQGRYAANFALGNSGDVVEGATPMGIYTIPEIAYVGLSEADARKQHGNIIVGQANLADCARGQIMAVSTGFLKLITDETGRRLLGVKILGDSATELIHIGQMALDAGFDIDRLAHTNFNFPTMAQAYRSAALDVVLKRRCAADRSALSEPSGLTTAAI